MTAERSIESAHAYRIGGSEAAAVCGVDPFCSPFRLAAQKLGLIERPDSGEAMRLGNHFEAAHVELLASEGWEVLPAPPNDIPHPDRDWQCCHPDGFVTVDGLRGVLELKLRGTDPADSSDWFPYVVQAHHNMDVTGLPVALVSVVHGGYGGIRRSEMTVSYDEELAAIVRRECVAFIATLRQGVDAIYRLPAASGDSVSAYPDGETGLQRRATTRIDRHVAKARYHKAMSDFHGREFDRHAEHVKAFMGESTLLVTADGEPLAKWSAGTRTSLDAAALRSAHPAIAEEFTQHSPVRRFTLHPQAKGKR